MVPPGDRQYFFSIAGQQYAAKDKKIIVLNELESDFTSLKAVNIERNVPLKILSYD